MDLVAVLDVGKTNLKLACFDEAGNERFHAERPTPWRDVPPYPHADTDAIWAWALGALREAGKAGRVRHIVPTTHGASAALVGEDSLVLPVMDYEWQGLEEHDAAYRALRPTFAETCSPSLPRGLNLGRQVFHQATREPSSFARARWLLPYPQYWAWRLTGVACAEVTSLGCHTDLWAPRAAAPSSLAVARGWDRLLPPLRRAWEVVGPPRPDVADWAGLAPDVSVHAGIHDSNGALLPHLAGAPGKVTVVSTGTWFILMAVGASLDRLDPALDMLANVAATGELVATARFMGGREHAALLDGAQAHASLDDVRAVLDSGALALPCFAPQGGPFHDRSGRVQGVLPDRPGARAGLACLYLALMTDWLLDRLGTGDGPLVVEGHAATDPVFVPVLASLRPEAPVRRSAGSGGTAEGAAMLAAWGGKAPRASPPAIAVDAGLRAILQAYQARWRALL